MGPMRSSYIALHGDEAVVAATGGSGTPHDPWVKELVMVLQVSNLQWLTNKTYIILVHKTGYYSHLMTLDYYTHLSPSMCYWLATV